MTKLTPDKPLTRETAELERTTPIAIRLHPRYLEIWLKATRETYRVDYAAILDLARKRAWKTQRTNRKGE